MVKVRSVGDELFQPARWQQMHASPMWEPASNLPESTTFKVDTAYRIDIGERAVPSTETKFLSFPSLVGEL